MSVDPLSAAAEHGELQPRPVHRFGPSLARRLVERLTRFLTEPQRAYNRGVIDAIQLLRQEDQDLARRISLQAEDYDRVAAGLRSELTQLELILADLQTTASLRTGQTVELARALQHLESQVAELVASIAHIPAPEPRQEHDRDRE